MDAKQDPILTRPQSDQRLKKALQRFFQAVDDALHAAAVAERARRELEKMAGDSVEVDR